MLIVKSNGFHYDILYMNIRYFFQNNFCKYIDKVEVEGSDKKVVEESKTIIHVER
jgi:hypothetical protein